MDTHTEIRAIGVSHTQLAKMRGRQNLGSHSWSVFFLLNKDKMWGKK